MAKFLAYIEIGLVGCKRQDEFEVDDEELEGLSEQERDDTISEYAKEVVFQYLDWGYKPLN